MKLINKIFKYLGVASVPLLATWAIMGAVVVPLVLFETGASKETNEEAENTAKLHWIQNFAQRKADGSIDHTDTLDKHFQFKTIDNYFKVDNRLSTLFELTDENGNIINADSNKVMIFSHGLNSTHWNVMETAYFWELLGYRVYSWDQRGGGENIDKNITFGFEEGDDLNNLYKKVAQDLSDKTDGTGPKRIIMYGQSNGAATVLSFATRYQESIKEFEGKNIETMFVEESGYTSPKRQFDSVLDLHNLIPSLIVPLTIPMYELYAKQRLSTSYDYLENSKNIEQPLFIAHGDADEVVDYKMGLELYDEMKTKNILKNQSIMIVDGLGHLGISRAARVLNRIMTNQQRSYLEGLFNNTFGKKDDKRDLRIIDNQITKNVWAHISTAAKFFWNIHLFENGIMTEDKGGH